MSPEIKIAIVILGPMIIGFYWTFKGIRLALDEIREIKSRLWPEGEQ